MEAIDKKQEAWLDSIFPPIEAWYVKGRKFLLDRGFHEESTLNNFVCGYDTSKGYCTITFYGPQPLGDGSYSTTTATGTACSQGRTCAADWSIYPAGTVIYIANDPLGGDGYYTVEDRGPGVTGNHIDIYVDDVSAYSTTSREVSVA